MQGWIHSRILKQSSPICSKSVVASRAGFSSGPGWCTLSVSRLLFGSDWVGYGVRISNQFSLLLPNQREGRLNAIFTDSAHVKTNPMFMSEESNCDIMILSRVIWLSKYCLTTMSMSSIHCPVIYTGLLARVSLYKLSFNNGAISNSDQYQVKMQSEIYKSWWYDMHLYFCLA